VFYLAKVLQNSPSSDSGTTGSASSSAGGEQALLRRSPWGCVTSHWRSAHGFADLCFIFFVLLSERQILDTT